MTKTKLASFVIIESGRRGNKVYYPRNNKQCVRTYVVPVNPDTLMQRENRSKFASAVKTWQSLDNERKQKYGRKARHLNMSGYNLFLSEYITYALNKMRRQQFKCGSFPGASDSVPEPIHSVSKPFLSLSLMIALLGTVKTSRKYG